MGEQPGLLVLQPDELLFSNIRLGQVLPVWLLDSLMSSLVYYPT